MKNLQEHFDYDSSWYIDYGFQLTSNYIFLIFLPHTVVPLYLLAKRKIKTYLMKKKEGSSENIEISE